MPVSPADQAPHADETPAAFSTCDNGRWLLMEAELIEPDLYLGMDPQGGAAFARALLGTIQRGMDRSA